MECIQQDKLFSGFNIPAGTDVLFSFAVVNGDDQHTISFVNPAFSRPDLTLSWGYNISVVPGASTQLSSVSGDLLQSAGQASLDFFANNSAVPSFSFTQTGAISSGTSSATFAPGTTSLSVIDKLTVGHGGSNTVGVTNAFVQTSVVPVPEPATWALTGLGFALLGGFGLRRRQGVAAFE